MSIEKNKYPIPNVTVMVEFCVIASTLWKIQCVGKIPKKCLKFSGTKKAAIGKSTSILKAFIYIIPCILFLAIELIDKT